MMMINVNNSNNNNNNILVIIINWLRAGRYGDRIPIGVRFSSLGQTGTGDHPVYSIIGTGSSPGLKRSRRDFDQSPPPPSSAKAEERVQLYLLPLWAFVAFSGVNFAVL